MDMKNLFKFNVNLTWNIFYEKHIITSKELYGETIININSIYICKLLMCIILMQLCKTFYHCFLKISYDILQICLLSTISRSSLIIFNLSNTPTYCDGQGIDLNLLCHVNAPHSNSVACCYHVHTFFYIQQFVCPQYSKSKMIISPMINRESKMDKILIYKSTSATFIYQYP